MWHGVVLTGFGDVVAIADGFTAEAESEFRCVGVLNESEGFFYASHGCIVGRL